MHRHNKLYDIIDHELNIPTDNIQFQAVHRVGKPRQLGKETKPRPIIARFVLREDRDCVLNKNKKYKLKASKRYEGAYITQDYARAVQTERKTLIKAMFKAKEKGLVNRNTIIGNSVFNVGNIPVKLKAV